MEPEKSVGTATEASVQPDGEGAAHRDSLARGSETILNPMSFTPTMTGAPQVSSPSELVEAVELARAMAREEAEDRGYDPDQTVGGHVTAQSEDDAAVTHVFDAEVPGYRGWRWEVTVAWAGTGFPVTVSEVLLRPGPGALVAKEWVPWERRVQPGDLGVGDIFPTPSDDDRLVPGYVGSDDPAVEETAMDTGLGRVRVLSRIGRLQTAERWRDGEFGPRSDMARSAPEACGTCGFYQPMAGSLSAAFGVCCNEFAPADGRVVNVQYGCGAHSEIEVEASASVPVADLVYDDSQLDVVANAPTETPAPEQPAEVEAPAAATEPVTPEATTDAAAPAETPEATTDAATPAEVPEAAPETTPEATSDAVAEVIPETAPESAPETAETAESPEAATPAEASTDTPAETPAPETGDPNG